MSGDPANSPRIRHAAVADAALGMLLARRRGDRRQPLIEYDIRWRSSGVTMRHAIAKHLLSWGIEGLLLRHNAPTGIPARMDEFDLARLGECFKSPLDSSTRAVYALHDDRHT